MGSCKPPDAKGCRHAGGPCHCTGPRAWGQGRALVRVPQELRPARWTVHRATVDALRKRFCGAAQAGAAMRGISGLAEGDAPTPVWTWLRTGSARCISIKTCVLCGAEVLAVCASVSVGMPYMCAPLWAWLRTEKAGCIGTSGLVS